MSTSKCRGIQYRLLQLGVGYKQIKADESDRWLYWVQADKDRQKWHSWLQLGTGYKQIKADESNTYTHKLNTIH